MFVGCPLVCDPGSCGAGPRGKYHWVADSCAVSAQGLSRQETASFLTSTARAQRAVRQVSERASRKRGARNKSSSGESWASSPSGQSGPKDGQKGGSGSGQGGGGETVKSGGEQHQADSGKGMQVQRLLLLLDGALTLASREAAAVQLAQLFEVPYRLSLP
jgi:hypothetical protein